MAKSSTRRVTIYINGKEVEASLLFPPLRPLMPFRGMHVHVTFARTARAAPIYQ
ncbi:MAG: hypothetical protein IK013_04275 [Bacteroidales bacterium]|nr:hypothetical protein [Bacteroidales bacterium]